MSYSSVLNEMQTIQSRLVQAGILQASTKAKAATSASSASSAASFASALTDATATDTTLGAAPTTATASATATTAATDGTTIGANGVTGDDVVQAALTYQGTPYVLGGESKSGIDCSGLVQAAFSKLGVSVPRLVHEQETVGQQVDSLKDAKPGDLIVLNGGDHVAIYMGNDTVIHAPYAGRTVSVQKAWFDDSDITSIRRIVPATDDSATAVGTSGTTASGADASGTNANGLSLATVARATAMLSMFGADAGLYGGSADSSSSDSSSSSTSLTSLLSSFGITGSSSTGSTTSSVLSSLGLSGSTTSAASTSTTSAATQQNLAAVAAMYGTSAS